MIDFGEGTAMCNPNVGLQLLSRPCRFVDGVEKSSVRKSAKTVTIRDALYPAFTCIC